MSKFYVTTPIYYINDKPHIGHAYSTIAADVLARWHRQHGDEVLFSTGVDENSQKTVQAAGKDTSAEIQKYADGMSKVWTQTFSELGISLDKFIRTSDPDHHKAVAAFFKAVKKEDIYKGTYEGWYCPACEEFKREEDLKDGHCLMHPNQKVEKLKEENYFFKLSNYQKPILEHIKQYKEFVQPKSRYNEVLAFVERGLEDISISRPAKGWGIPYPGDKEQVVYVWFDALINYLTVAGYPDKKFDQWWPANVHIVGKDIIKFHCIIWPAMLMSAGMKLPEHVFAHGFFTIDGTKISKSLGNVVDPLDLAGTYGNDALRYYLLRDIPFGQDGDFSHERFHSVYDSDLANELGNLVQRTAAMIAKYMNGEFGEVEPHEHDVVDFETAMGQLRFDKALEEIWENVKGLNQYIEEEKPWQLSKAENEGDQAHLEEVLRHLVSDILQVAELLVPFLPDTAEKIQQTFADGKVNSKIGILFPKIELDVTPVE